VSRHIISYEKGRKTPEAHSSVWDRRGGGKGGKGNPEKRVMTSNSLFLSPAERRVITTAKGKKKKRKKEAPVHNLPSIGGAAVHHHSGGRPKGKGPTLCPDAFTVHETRRKIVQIRRGRARRKRRERGEGEEPGTPSS